MIRMISYLVAFTLGVIITVQVSGDPEVRYEQHTVTQYKTRDVEVETYVSPKSCTAALKLMESLYPLMVDYDNALGPQGQVVDKAMGAIIKGDHEQLNEAVTEQKTIRDNTLPAANALSRQIRTLRSEVSKCQSDLGE